MFKRTLELWHSHFFTNKPLSSDHKYIRERLFHALMSRPEANLLGEASISTQSLKCTNQYFQMKSSHITFNHFDS